MGSVVGKHYSLVWFGSFLQILLPIQFMESSNKWHSEAIVSSLWTQNTGLGTNLSEHIKQALASQITGMHDIHIYNNMQQ